MVSKQGKRLAFFDAQRCGNLQLANQNPQGIMRIISHEVEFVLLWKDGLLHLDKQRIHHVNTMKGKTHVIIVPDVEKTMRNTCHSLQ